jgi:hypothetical protein
MRDVPPSCQSPVTPDGQREHIIGYAGPHRTKSSDTCDNCGEHYDILFGYPRRDGSYCLECAGNFEKYCADYAYQDETDSDEENETDSDEENETDSDEEDETDSDE